MDGKTERREDLEEKDDHHFDWEYEGQENLEDQKDKVGDVGLPKRAHPSPSSLLSFWASNSSDPSSSSSSSLSSSPPSFSPTPPKMVFCVQCGKKITEGLACPHCGHKPPAPEKTNVTYLPGQKLLTLRDIQHVNVSDIDNQIKEMYLSDAEFQSVFGMDKHAWEHDVPAWKKTQLKRKLFIY